MRVALLGGVVACGSRRAPPEPISPGVAMVILRAPASAPGVATLSIVPVRALVFERVEWSVAGHPTASRAGLGDTLRPAGVPLEVSLSLPELRHDLRDDLRDDLPPVVQGTVHARGRLGTPVRQTFLLPPLPEPP